MKINYLIQFKYYIIYTTFHSKYYKNCPNLNYLYSYTLINTSPDSPLLNMAEGQFIIQQYQNFQSKLKIRQKIHISLDPNFQAIIDMMEYSILSKFQKNAKNLYKNKKNRQCDKLFKKAFKQLMDIQKIEYYCMIVTHLENIINQNLKQPIVEKGSNKASCYSKTYSKIGWKQVLVKLDFDKKYLYIERQNKVRAYDLHFYIIRRSKATQFNSFVLQAINEVINQKGHQIHIGFKYIQTFQLWNNSIKNLINYIFWQKIKNTIFSPQVIQMLQTKAFQQDINCQNKFQDQINLRMSQSSVNNSQKFIANQAQDRFSKPLTKFSSGYQSQKSHQKSSQSIQIKSSPRSSIKQSQVIVQCFQNNDNCDECQTFRSFAMIESQDIENLQDQSVIFRRMFPEYELQQIQLIQKCNQLVYQSADKTLKIYSNIHDSKKIKIFINLNSKILGHSYETFSALFCSPQFQKSINDQMQQTGAKTVLTSDHCAILYQKNKGYNRLYRSRDFVFIRHQFKKGKRIYIVDKSVQEPNIPPFTTIVRGQMVVIYQIYEDEDNLRLSIDASIQNNGYLKDMQQLNLNIKFFKGYQNIQSKIKLMKGKNIATLFQPLMAKTQYFQSIHQLEQNPKKIEINLIKKQQDKVKQFLIRPSEGQIKTDKFQMKKGQKDTQFQTIHLNNDIKKSNIDEYSKNINQIHQSLQKMQIQGQISVIQESKQSGIIEFVKNFNHQGQIIISSDYLFKKSPTVPQPSQKKQFTYLKRSDNLHPIWKGNWQFLEQGGLKFINKKQIQEQKGVLKFILSQVAKNLVSGKSILNISLPVDIFSTCSNLQRFVYSMSYGPILLQQASKMDELNRFLQTIVFGMTNSPMYLDMEKPFNPIIGQTFQSYINGCPAYAEQISHHPPIAAFLLYGRGYQVSAQIQSKMKLNINSGTGSNTGVYRIRFEDSEQICYICPSGQVSGLAYGDRKFNMIGKAYAWSEKSCLFVEITFNPKKGGYFDRQQNPIDYFEGRICKAKESFIKSFIKSAYKLSLQKNAIVKQLGLFHGNWNKQLKYEDKTLFSYEFSLPLQMEYEVNPLPSDSNWRQDIVYRRLNQITKAQSWKQKLEIKQRDERRLRQKYRTQK